MLELMKQLAALDANQIMATVHAGFAHAKAAHEAMLRIEAKQDQILALLKPTPTMLTVLSQLENTETTNG